MWGWFYGFVNIGREKFGESKISSPMFSTANILRHMVNNLFAIDTTDRCDLRNKAC